MESKKKVLIWGTGVRATELLQNGINAAILGFIDYVKRSDYFFGHEVFDVGKFPKKYDYILVATEYTDQIKEICKTEKIDLERVVFLYAGEESEFNRDPVLQQILGEINYKRYQWEYDIGAETVYIKFAYNKLAEKVNDLKRCMEIGLAACECNKRAFSKFKGCCRGKKLVLCGAGPSLNDFIPIKDAVYIAVNRAVLYEKVKFDYMFADDWIGLAKYQEEILKIDCKKFFGAHQGDERYMIPESFYMQNNAVKYYKDDFLRPSGLDSQFVCDVDLRPIGSMPNIALQVMQVALFMQPDVIYLVGCDASPAGHFVGKDIKTDLKQFAASDAVLAKWRELKHFAEVHYPNVEIVSINPVGLKDLFKDVYQ